MVNALERLTAYLCSNPGSEHMDDEYAAFASRLLNQHAHELAEKLRTEVRNATGVGREEWSALICDVDRLVATIDPEVL